jgi:uncharacterized repeat protein (TIGR01451 family)
MKKQLASSWLHESMHRSFFWLFFVFLWADVGWSQQLTLTNLGGGFVQANFLFPANCGIRIFNWGEPVDPCTTTNPNGNCAVHYYNSPGTYTVTAFCGATSLATGTITVGGSSIDVTTAFEEITADCGTDIDLILRINRPAGSNPITQNITLSGTLPAPFQLVNQQLPLVINGASIPAAPAVLEQRIRLRVPICAGDNLLRDITLKATAPSGIFLGGTLCGALIPCTDPLPNQVQTEYKWKQVPAKAACPSVVKTATNNPVAPGQMSHFSVVVTNTGNASANGMIVEDMFGAGLVPIPSSLPPLSTISGNSIMVADVSLAPNASWTMTPHFAAKSACGIGFTNQARVKLAACGYVSNWVSATTQPTGNPNSFYATTSQKLSDIANFPTTGSTTPVTLYVSDNVTLDATYGTLASYTFPLGSNIVMGRNAKILVPTGRSIVFRNTHIYGCEYLWNTIELQNQADLTMRECVVEDAKFAITVIKDSKLVLRDCQILNNFVGVEAFNNVVHTATDWSIIGSTFASTRTLLPKPDNSTPILADNKYGLVGMRLRRVRGLHVDPINKNTFYQLTVGVQANESFIGAFNNFLIYSIWNQARGGTNYYSQSYGGRAIYVYNMSSINIQNPEGTTNIEQCIIGIYGSQSSVKSLNTVIKSADEGIYLYKVSGQEVDLKYNYIYPTYYGIRINEAINPYLFILDNNYVYLQPYSDASFIPRSCIFINNAVLSTTQENQNHVYRNACYANKKANGIYLLNCSRTLVFQNTIFLSGAKLSSGLNGILVEGSMGVLEETNNYISNNIIEGTTSDCLSQVNVTGIKVTNSSNNLYCCNETKNLYQGVFFQGACLSTNRFKGNKFDTHAIGLRVKADGSIGMQEHVGNQWLTTMGLEGAIHDNPPVAQNQKIKIHNTTFPNYPSPNPNPSGWFETNSGTPFFCNTGGINNLCGFELDPPEGYRENFSDFQKQVAQGAYTSPEHDVVVNYTIRHDMLTQIWQDPARATLSNLQSWWQTNQPSDVGQLAYVTTLSHQLGQLNATEQAATSVNRHSRDSLLVERHIVDSLINHNGSTQSLLTQRENIATQLASLANDLDLIRANQRIDDLNLLADLQSTNAAITPLGVPAENQSQVNAIWYNWIENPIDTFTNSQTNTLQSIAEQCPMEGGNAVFMARSMLYRIGYSFQHNDSICSVSDRSDGQYVADNKTSPLLLICPNPSHDGQVTIKYQVAKPAVLIITNAIGQVYYQKTLDAESYSLLTIQNTPSGIYFVTLLEESKSASIKTLLVH